MLKKGISNSGGDCSTKAERQTFASAIYEYRSGLLIGATSFIQKLFGCDKQAASFRHLCWNSLDLGLYGDLCNTGGYIPPLLAISTPFRPFPPEGLP